MRSQRTTKNTSGKAGVVSLAGAARMAQAAHRAGKRVVTTNGCFDILHIGHVRYLSWAKRQGDLLIVGINSDSSVRKLKGPLRPITPEKERVEILAALKAVDAAFIFNESTPERWLAQIKPDIHVKGGDRSMR